MKEPRHLKCIRLSGPLSTNSARIVSRWSFSACSLPQEDSEADEVPLSSYKTSSRRTAASLLSCLRKQKSDQDPLMRRIAQPLRMAQAQVPTIHAAFYPPDLNSDHDVLIRNANPYIVCLSYRL